MNKSIVSKNITQFQGNINSDFSDTLAIEEPLEIRLIYGPKAAEKKLSVTMRTPGNDEELAAGFLFTEGIICSKNEIEQIRVSPIDPNIIFVHLLPEVILEMQSLERNFYTTSSCGVCGKSSIDAVKTQCKLEKTKATHWHIDHQIIYSLPKKLREQQEVFNSTGGLHASALFTPDGAFIALREDVGRHNALDKLIGYQLLHAALPLSQHILLLSGRASFELIQKAMMAGIQIVAAIGAPSSLAAELALSSEITLIGFLKENKMNIYSCGERINVVPLHQ